MPLFLLPQQLLQWKPCSRRRSCCRGQRRFSGTSGDRVLLRSCCAPCLADCGRRDARARGAVDLERLHRERELVDALRDQLVELQVFQDVDAVHHQEDLVNRQAQVLVGDRKSTRLNSSHGYISYAVFCLKKKKKTK